MLNSHHLKQGLKTFFPHILFSSFTNSLCTPSSVQLLAINQQQVCRQSLQTAILSNHQRAHTVHRILFKCSLAKGEICVSELSYHENFYIIYICFIQFTLFNFYSAKSNKCTLKKILFTEIFCQLHDQLELVYNISNQILDLFL